MNKRWYRKNREKVLAQSREYYQKNRKRRLEQCSKWNKTHPNNLSCAQKKWKSKNPTYYLEWGRRNCQKVNAQKRAKYAANITSARAVKQKWREKNRLLCRIYVKKYEALKKAATINLEGIKQWIAQIKSKKSVVCYYCGDRISISRMHIDHIVPLSKGGAHSVENLCVACAPCNHSKSDKPIRTWIRMGQQVLEL
jgi:5-methylcytosine-specific restriction endonuclease McrA